MENGIIVSRWEIRTESHQEEDGQDDLLRSSSDAFLLVYVSVTENTSGSELLGLRHSS